MPQTTPTLYMVCGKIAAGKSTLCAQLAHEKGAVLISEDDWLSALYGDQMESIEDFLRLVPKLRAVVAPHATQLLRAGLPVVLDFQANTRASRSWMRGIFEAAEAAHELHVLEAPDALCLERLQARNAAGAHPFAATEAQFHQINCYIEPPEPAEGFRVIRHTVGP